MLKMNGVVRLVALPLAWSCSLLASELCCTWPFQSSDFPFINQHLSWHQGCIRAGPQLEYWDDHYGGMFF